MSSDVTRTNYSANSILTSTALNADFNQILTRINDFPGDQITNATVTKDKLASGAIANSIIATKTSAYTVTTSDQVLLGDASGGAFTFTLPTAVGNEGLVFTLKKIDSSVNAITIDGNGSETIDGATTKIFYSQWDTLKIVSDNSNWVILENGIKDRYQLKILSANVTANSSDVGDLKYTNLVAGRIYEITGHIFLSVGSSAGAIANCSIYHDGTKIAGAVTTRDGTNAEFECGISTIFTATTTTLITQFAEVTDGTLRGNGTTSQSYLALKDVTERFVLTTELD